MKALSRFSKIEEVAQRQVRGQSKPTLVAAFQLLCIRGALESIRLPLDTPVSMSELSMTPHIGPKRSKEEASHTSPFTHELAKRS